jgi:hypothetical protein
VEIRGCAATVSEELERAFRIIKNLNAFAHSADHAQSDIDAAETARLTASLAGYLSFAGRARIEPPSGTSARVTTCPLLLEDLLYRILEGGYRSAGRDAPASIAVQGVGGDVELRIAGFEEVAPGDLLGADALRILTELGGEAGHDDESGDLWIRLRQ